MLTFPSTSQCVGAVVRIALGGVLLVAAGLKLYGREVSPYAQYGLAAHALGADPDRRVGLTDAAFPTGGAN